MRVVLGVSGASGAVLALDCARALARAGAEIDLVLSAMAERTLAEEVRPDALGQLQATATRVHPRGDLGAAIASGSCPVAGMIVAPYSMRSLAAIAHGFDDSLLTRAVILPPVPAFYLRPASLADVTTQIAARAVYHLHLAPSQARAWTPEPAGENP
ncbi:flavoprotein [Paracoccus litorisediminis]|uniref:Phenolic acid decarboxylase n=1 Tax=Paracoccus litorisediminis TaxID=2006130 RepID=A0A844HW68_9RHOB|nr:flavoprotein [Paracoccus litorisediminis]MTH61712.1 phenolic acid decarboxylase [Paracoccus litorisediminis]